MAFAIAEETLSPFFMASTPLLAGLSVAQEPTAFPIKPSKG